MMLPSHSWVDLLGRLPCCAPLLAAGIACTHSTPAPTQLFSPTDVRAFVTPRLAATLDPQGFYVLPQVAGDSTHIGASRAAELAAKEVVTFEQFNRTYLESQRGVAIDFNALHVEPRVYYAVSPYVQDIPPDVHPAIRKLAGPYYLVTLSDLNGPVLSVAVSAYNTDVTIENGHLLLAPHHGGDFRVQAARIGSDAGLPVSPEHATRIAAQALHVAVSTLPVLILPSNSYVPQHARWRLELERPVTVRGARSGRVTEVQTVYVGLGGQLSIPVTGDAGASGRPKRDNPI